MRYNIDRKWACISRNLRRGSNNQQHSAQWSCVLHWVWISQLIESRKLSSFMTQLLYKGKLSICFFWTINVVRIISLKKTKKNTQALYTYGEQWRVRVQATVVKNDKQYPSRDNCLIWPERLQDC